MKFNEIKTLMKKFFQSRHISNNIMVKYYGDFFVKLYILLIKSTRKQFKQIIS